MITYTAHEIYKLKKKILTLISSRRYPYQGFKKQSKGFNVSATGSRLQLQPIWS